MSKAVLVIDMPESCVVCPCHDYTRDKCRETGEDITDDNLFLKRPEWCPLRELTKKKDFNSELKKAIEQSSFDGNSSQDYTFLVGKIYGWNACINTITGEREE